MWMTACGIGGQSPTAVKGQRICSNHFVASDYLDLNARLSGGKLKLKRNTVPTVSIPNATSANGSESPLNAEIRKRLSLNLEEKQGATKGAKRQRMSESNNLIVVNDSVSISNTELNVKTNDTEEEATLSKIDSIKMVLEQLRQKDMVSEDDDADAETILVRLIINYSLIT